MRKEKVSLRGKVVRDMMKNMMDSAMGHKFQTGEYRANPVEPAWICPADYDYEIIELGDCKMEYLRPSRCFYRQSNSAASWRRVYWPHEKYLSGFCHASIPDGVWEAMC